MSVLPGLPHPSGSLRRAVRSVVPSPRSTPLTCAVVAAILFTAVVLRIGGDDVHDAVAWTSTNLHNLGHHPFAAMLGSVFVVPGPVLPQLLLVAVVFAVVERVIGAWRTALIGLAGHVLATLATEYGAALAADLHLIAAAPADRVDVGVSYATYAVLSAGTLLFTGRVRIVGLTAIALSLAIPFALDHDMTATGHLLAVLVGAGAVALLRRRPAVQAARAVPAASAAPARPVRPGAFGWLKAAAAGIGAALGVAFGVGEDNLT